MIPKFRKRFKKKGDLRSGLEALIAKDLEDRGIKFQYEPDVLIYERKITGATCGDCGSKNITRKARYTPDFKLGDGSYVEAKGRFTSANRARMADFKRSSPLAAKVRLLFAANNWTTAAKKERYTDWAERIGFVSAVGKIVPKEWVPNHV